MEDNVVITKWTELKAIVDAYELDIVKNAKGVAAAGVRARAGLRALKQKASELVKVTVDLDKDLRAKRTAAKAAAKAAKAAPAASKP